MKIPKKACSVIHTKTQAALISFHVLSDIYLLLLFSRQLSKSLQPHGLCMPALPVPHHLLEFAQVHVHWIGDDIQLSHPLLLPSVFPSISVTPFFCLQFFPASGSFLMSQLFSSGGQSIKASASVLPMNIQGWFPLGLTGLISLLSKGLSQVFSSTTVQKHQILQCSDV